MAEADMTASADLLWRINNEYRLRLSRASKYLDLLDMLLSRHEAIDRHVLEIVHETQTQLHGLGEEHRGWRYAFFYETVENKRMVQDERDVMRALAQFNRMSQRHHQRLGSIQDVLISVSRPPANLTVVTGGDLWEMMEFALSDMADFLGAPNQRTQ